MSDNQRAYPKRTAPLPTSTGDDVLNLLREQGSLYQRLARLADRQHSMVSDENVGPLLVLLADRSKLSDKLTILGKQLAPIRKDWKRYHDGLEGQQRQEAEQLIQDAQQCLQQIMRSDEEDARVLSSRKQTIAHELRTSHTRGAALSAYQTPVVRARRLDCMDEIS